MSAGEIQLVERFYHQIWNQRRFDLAPEILHGELEFRGSLGMTRHGIDQFIDYASMVHAALAGYQCHIQDVIDQPGRVAAQMLFVGRHVGPFLGVEATNRQVQWAGAAFFTIEGERIRRLWVLGDVDGLKAQLTLG